MGRVLLLCSYHSGNGDCTASQGAVQSEGLSAVGYGEEDNLFESKKAPLTEAVKKASLNNLVAEILRSDPPKPIKRPGDAVKWFKDLAKDKEFVKEQTNKFIDGKKLDKAIDFLENINYLLTIGESEATKLVKKYATDEKKFPLIKA